MNLNEFIKNEKDAKSCLIGTIIADGSIEKQRTPNGRANCEITHTGRNIDYLKIKKQIFEMIQDCYCTIKPHNKTTENKTYELFRLVTNKHDWFTELRGNMYDQYRNKLFKKEYINTMSDLGLFFLYLDDGSLKVRYYEGTDRIRECRVELCLDSFTLDELKYFQEWLLNNYYIQTKFYRHTKCTDLNRGFRLWTNTENTNKLMSIFDKFYDLVPSMKYKFVKNYNLS